ncbi:PDR/VanB family oxidoreductase [Aestuariivirga sp.]|uniref:PDR/VanB family oxidoreductase n=1 Tax=Aestuariivirga sp. TaxID=2650926 RepID=UPI0025B84251|nr:PDR/VanB family oxidoreductase [Aestuariivirga sp.]MCA3555393.1 oxidoreductase [Aestuariivirga sp.]
MTINTEMKVRVTEIRQVADKVKRFRFERAGGGPMPVFSGGAHVIVSMRDGKALRRNPYSLMSSPEDTKGYEISVLRVENSRGGSAFLHEKLKEGDELVLSQPVNLFPFDQRGKKHIMMAGGIGITPFIAMMEQMERGGKAFELYYAVRTRSHGAYWKELQQRYGAHRVKIYCDAEKLFIPVGKILANQPLGTHLYVCGPAGMINGVLGKASELGWPRQNLHAEEFLAPPPGKAFQVRLAKSNRAIDVAPHQSILEALEANGVDAPYLCRGGACGQCETGVVSCDGGLEHNDHFLEPDEKASGKKIMICVSRITGNAVTLDL